MNSRNIFLTGASSGIGLKTAQLLATRGFQVWGTSRNPARLPKLPGFHPVRMDLARTDSIRDGFTEALKEAGAFDVLISNAGAGVFGPLEAMPMEMVCEQFQVLVEAPAELIRLTLPQMRARGSGLIINITSLAAILPVPFMTPYSAAKAALSLLTQGLRMELANTAIRVVEIRPGDINTAFHVSTNRVNLESWEGHSCPDRQVRSNQSEGRSRQECRSHEAMGLTQESQARIRAAWETQLRNMAAAPPPAAVAKAILRVMENPRPRAIVTVGGFFQARVAPLAVRLLPPRLLEFGLRRYYRL